MGQQVVVVVVEAEFVEVAEAGRACSLLMTDVRVMIDAIMNPAALTSSH